MTMKKKTIIAVENLFEVLQLSGIGLLLLMAFVLQFVLNELPCPLCLLQRLGFLLAASGVLLNLRFGLHPSHYAMTLLGAIYTAFVALRQIALHVVPGTGAYGGSVFGFHLYTWCFIIAMVIIIATTIMLGIDSQYDLKVIKKLKSSKSINIVFALMAALVVANIIGILMECGLTICSDNPINYLIKF
jgi:disulfide bond formation protein DsbB